MAGESAREVARKRRAKAERLNRVADAYERGADGERQTADALAMLPAFGWFVLHDVRWPGKRFANIDHVVVGPPGVFVIDSKAWNGVVEVRNGVLRQSGYSREPAVASAADAAMAVAEQVPGLDPYAVQPVLCFVGDHQLEGWARDVMLCTTANLVPMLTSRPQVLDGPAVRRTLLGLQQALKAATSAPPATVRRTPRPSRRGASARHSGAGRTIVRLLGLLVLIGLILFGIQQLPKLGSPLAHVITSGLTPKPTAGAQGRPLGTAERLAPGTHRPPLRVTADHAITARRVGALPYLYTGERFFAVRVQIKNLGRRPWVSQPGTTMQALDTYNIPHPSVGMMRIREGRVLPDSLRVPPGHVTRGYVVFEVSRTMPVTGFRVTVGPGEPRTATWTIDHQ